MVRGRVRRGWVDADAILPDANSLEGAWMRWRHGPGADPIPRKDLGRWRTARGKDVHLLPEDHHAEPDVHVVITLTGWTDQDARAVNQARHTLAGQPADLVVVQNQPAAHRETWRWCHTRGVQVVPTPNHGFAAANNAGAAVATRRWILFTQADVEWSWADVTRAVDLSYRTADRLPGAVGPSGGHLLDPRTGQVDEWGRQVGHRGDPRRVDWLAGYWVLVHRQALLQAGGWCPHFFLYMEDPDLCLRLEKVGSPSVVDPDLSVNHARTGTIGRMCGAPLRARIQADSRRRFAHRWTGTPYP